MFATFTFATIGFAAGYLAAEYDLIGKIKELVEAQK